MLNACRLRAHALHQRRPIPVAPRVGGSHDGGLRRRLSAAVLVPKPGSSRSGGGVALEGPPEPETRSGHAEASGQSVVKSRRAVARTEKTRAEDPFVGLLADSPQARRLRFSSPTAPANDPSTTRRSLQDALRRAVVTRSSSTARRELDLAWRKVYLPHLSSSSSPADFAKRFGMVLRRLPRSQIPPFISLHSSTEFARLATTASFNQILSYAHTDASSSSAFEQPALREMAERGLDWDSNTYRILLSAAAKKGDWGEVAAVRRKMERAGLAMTAFSWSRMFDQSASGAGASDGHEMMDVEAFLKGWKWGPPPPGAVATVTTRLLEEGRLNDAEYLVDRALELPNADELGYNASSALGLLRILVASGPPSVSSSAVEYVGSFVRRHPRWRIDLDAATFLTCLRRARLSPSQIVSTLESWTSDFRLDPSSLGSRTAVRTLQAMEIFTRVRPRGSVVDEASTMRKWWRERGLEMLGRGPKDARFVRGWLSYWAVQEVAPVEDALWRARKALRRAGLDDEGMTLDGLRWHGDVILEDDESGNLGRVYRWDSERQDAVDIPIASQE